MPAVGAGGKQPAPRCSRIAHAAFALGFVPVGQRRPRGFGKRHQALATAFADDRKKRLFAPCRRSRQRDEFGHAQPRRVEKFQKATHPHRPEPGGRRRLPVASLRRGPLQQIVDLALTEDLRQGPAAARTVQGLGRIVRARAALDHEPVELAQGRQPPLPGRRRETARVEIAQIGTDRFDRGRFDVGAPACGEAGKVLEIPPVGVQRVGGGKPFGGDHFKESLDRRSAPGRRAAIRCDQFSLLGTIASRARLLLEPLQGCRRSAGTRTEISRGSGSTNVTSANIAA